VDFVQYNDLVDLGFFGNKFTCSNHCPSRANIRQWLDRGLANHCPILLSTVGSYYNISRPFRFEAFWTRDKSSFSMVAEAGLAEAGGSPAFSLRRKWKNTKIALNPGISSILAIFMLK
jgi:hypothetical protein